MAAFQKLLIVKKKDEEDTIEISSPSGNNLNYVLNILFMSIIITTNYKIIFININVNS